MINHKKCISCKRVLNVEFFGSLKSSSDGYAHRCKGCTNHARRKSYARKKDPNYERAPIYVPLQEHNITLLNKLLTEELFYGESCSVSLYGAHCSEQTLYRIDLKKDSTWSYELYMTSPESGLMEGYMINRLVQRAYFIDLLLGHLQRLEIRLQESGEEQNQAPTPRLDKVPCDS